MLLVLTVRTRFHERLRKSQTETSSSTGDDKDAAV
jgi:hypothetical protein